MPLASPQLKQSLEDAMKHQISGRFKEAEDIYQQILQSLPDQPDATHLLGLVRMEQERDEEALSLMERALELFPGASHFHHNIAGLYRRMGKLAEAEQKFRRAIELKPDYGEAYQGLAEMHKFQADDPLIEKIQVQLRREDLGDGIRPYFHFAAGKIFDDIGKYRTAFQHFQKGNQLTGRKFDTAAFRQLTKDLLYNASQSQAKRMEGAGLDSEVPTFVVGMPRSGTTLVEQILASHSSVFGAGELNDMKFIATGAASVSRFKVPYPNCLPGIAKDDYGRLAQEYLNRVTAIAGDESVLRIIDKHPLNFQFIGLIYSLFPNARIIHTVRNPLDTCLSCFFQNFTKGQDYSFDLKSLAYFYNDYRRLMEHWELVYPGKIYTIRYEDLIDNQVEETSRLLDFMGLPFEDECIDFHNTDRKVSTASFSQVRQPIYKSSKQRWLNYSAELADVAAILGISIEPPITLSGGHSILR